MLFYHIRSLNGHFLLFQHQTFQNNLSSLHSPKNLPRPVGDSGFPTRRGRQPLRWGMGTNLLFGQIYPKNCMKMKEFDPEGGASLTPSLDPSMETIMQRRNDIFTARIRSMTERYCFHRCWSVNISGGGTLSRCGW